MKVQYDKALVPAHGAMHAQVVLMNEAPGPVEARAGVPCYGPQGGNIFRMLRYAGVGWACLHPAFAWPRDDKIKAPARQALKASSLQSRGEHMRCTNAYPYWPSRFGVAKENFCPPAEVDVLSAENLTRIRAEIGPENKVLLVCGRFAYLACAGQTLVNPKARELCPLSEGELGLINRTLGSSFEVGWYMGHTRRWVFCKNGVASVIRQVASHVGWATA